MVSAPGQAGQLFGLSLSLEIAPRVLVTSNAVGIPDTEIAILKSETERLRQLTRALWCRSTGSTTTRKRGALNEDGALFRYAILVGIPENTDRVGVALRDEKVPVGSPNHQSRRRQVFRFFLDCKPSGCFQLSVVRFRNHGSKIRTSLSRSGQLRNLLLLG